MKKVLIIAVAILVALGGAFFVYKRSDEGVIREPIPAAQVYKTPTPSINPVQATPKISPVQSSIKPTIHGLPAEINLAVPFTVQAPHANWEDPYGEFCEEASVLMAVSYVNGWAIPNAEIADQKLWEIKSFEEKRFGYYKDTTAEETAVIIRELYSLDRVKVLYEPKTDDIKKALIEGRVVIVPAAGQQLANPYFRQPGPLYHMFVIKGYTKDGNFITNDPGTRRGADYIYSPNVIMNAIHDWNGGDVNNGRKVVIIVG